MCTKRVPAVKYSVTTNNSCHFEKKIYSKLKVRHVNRRSGNLATDCVTINTLDSEVYAKHLT